MRSTPWLRCLLLAVCFVLIGQLVLAPAAPARPTIRTSFFNAYPTAATSVLASLPSHTGHCGVCHFDFNGGGARNPYGVRLGQVLGAYGNNDAGRQQAVHFIEGEDSDADGFTSLIEITSLTYVNTPTFPGLTSTNAASATNIPVLAELTPYLTPQSTTDTQAPTVHVTSPVGGETWSGGSARVITWTATDNVGVTSVDVYWHDSNAALWTPIRLGGFNAGTQAWFVPNMPTTAARVLVVAWDATGNMGRDSSSADFTVTAIGGGIAPTTLRDFDLPGTQPLQVGTPEASTYCLDCHAGFDATNEPGHLFKGSMMAQAGRDPLFYACLAIADRDAPSAGDLCIRCHSMAGWLAGRSQPTDGSQLGGDDRDGVNCDLCHRLVNPVYEAGVSPVEDPSVLAGLLPSHTPGNYANGQMVVDPLARRRGPFSDTVSPHQVLVSPFHQTGEFCGTCHDVSNPVFERTGPADYAPGTLDEPAPSLLSTDVMPLERTYSEWKHSAYPTGVYAPQFAGNRPDGIVRTCQDCHMPDASARGCNDPLAPLRPDLPRHDLTGGSAWMTGVVGALYPGETDPAAVADGAIRSRTLLAKSATLAISTSPEGDSTRAEVTITNLSGHKLPTGYPEGRRMWIHVVAYDASGTRVFESGGYDEVTGTRAEDVTLRSYETHLGISPGLAAALSATPGPSFHFALNDTVYLDNRVPPLGFTHAAYATFGGAPVDPGFPGPRYVDGQNWDVASYSLPRSARRVMARLLYQSTSREYVEFLRDENTTNSAGQAMYDAWVANGRSAPVEMVRDSAVFLPLGVDAAPASAWTLRGNPFRGALSFGITLDRPARLGWSVFDAQGRVVTRSPERDFGSGAHTLTWNGEDRQGRDAGSGVFWLRATVDGVAASRRVVRLR